MQENRPIAPQGGEEEAVSLKYRGKKEGLKAAILGFFIGLAVIVPGVSGSAVAIMMKLYERLLYAIANIIKKFKAAILFLLPIAAGGIVGFALGFLAVQQLLELIPFAIILFFAGLMLGAYPSIYDEYKKEKHTPLRIVLLVLGIAIPVAISLCSSLLSEGSIDLSNLQWYHYVLYLVLGFVMAITQLVPGLSATALLMACGTYTPLVESVSLTYWGENPMVFLVYGLLAVGFLVGLVVISKAVGFFLKKWRGATFHLIGGLSLGSIVSMIVSPEAFACYREWSKGSVDWLDLGLGAGLFVVGTALAFLFYFYESRKKAKEAAEASAA